MNESQAMLNLRKTEIFWNNFVSINSQLLILMTVQPPMNYIMIMMIIVIIVDLCISI